MKKYLACFKKNWRLIDDEEVHTVKEIEISSETTHVFYIDDNRFYKTNPAVYSFHDTYEYAVGALIKHLHDREVLKRRHIDVLNAEIIELEKKRHLLGEKIYYEMEKIS